jgi:hypothetical protein
MKFHALNSLYGQLEVVVEALEVIEEEARDTQMRATAAGFRRRLSDFDLYFCFVLACRLFESTDRLSTALQGTTISVGNGVKLVEKTLMELSRLRSDEQFQVMWNEAETRRIQLDVEAATLPRQVRAPRRFQQSTPTVFETIEQFFKGKYFEVLDMAQERLKYRITNKAVPVLIAIERLLLAGWNEKDICMDDVAVVCNHYHSDGFDTLRLTSQLINVANLREAGKEKYDISSIISVLNKEPVSMKLLPQVKKLLQLYLVCPATTASAERSFGALKRLKTSIRSTMCQKRLNALLILSTYPEEVDNLDMNKLINEFVLKNEMRRRVFSLS